MFLLPCCFSDSKILNIVKNKDYVSKFLIIRYVDVFMPASCKTDNFIEPLLLAFQSSLRRIFCNNFRYNRATRRKFNLDVSMKQLLYISGIN